MENTNQLIANFTTNHGEFKVKLFADLVPRTVSNFYNLVNSGLYNGTVFHRVIENFMIQGGDPEGTGMGGPGHRFRDEFVTELRHDKPGILSMANAGPNTNGSQFFITVVPTPHLDGAHTVFGEVVDGYDIVDKISKVATGVQDRPQEEVKLQNIRIEGEFSPIEIGEV